MNQGLNSSDVNVNSNPGGVLIEAGLLDAEPKATLPARSACKEYHRNPVRKREGHRRHCYVHGIIQSLKIYPGVTMMRNNHRDMSKVLDHEDREKRGKVTWFTSRSRRSMLLYLGMIDRELRQWQDLTFEDSTMAGKTVLERARFSSRVMALWKKKIKRKDWRIEGVWKREWKKRKSGDLIGQWVPHFHCVYDIYDENGNEIQKYDAIMALVPMWIEACRLKEGSEAARKAWKVLVNEKSFRLVSGRKYMIMYMTKYITKIEDDEIMGPGDNVESIGRCWGRFDKIPIADPEVHEMTYDEAVQFNRVMRKKMKWARGFLRESLNDPHGCYHVFIKDTEIMRYLEYLRRDKHEIKGVPF